MPGEVRKYDAADKDGEDPIDVQELGDGIRDVAPKNDDDRLTGGVVVQARVHLEQAGDTQPHSQPNEGRRKEEKDGGPGHSHSVQARLGIAFEHGPEEEDGNSIIQHTFTKEQSAELRVLVLINHRQGCHLVSGAEYGGKEEDVVHA